MLFLTFPMAFIDNTLVKVINEYFKLKRTVQFPIELSDMLCLKINRDELMATDVLSVNAENIFVVILKNRRSFYSSFFFLFS